MRWLAPHALTISTLLALGLSASRVLAAYPPDPTADIGWPYSFAYDADGQDPWARMNDDSGQGWGHRHLVLWYPYGDNSGPAGSEGFLGLGHAVGTFQGWSNTSLFVLNVFDPCAAWNYPAEIELRGNGQSIPSGDAIPSLLDRTDFGDVGPAGAWTTRTFYIHNLGDAPLNLTASPAVSVSGPGAAEFTVTAQPPAAIAPGGSEPFEIRFEPADVGLVGATVTIANDDPDEAVDQFQIQDAGIAPDLTLTKHNDVAGTVELPNGWNWTLTVDNLGNLEATFLDGEIVLVDALPAADVSYATPLIINVFNVTNAGDLNLAIDASQVLTVFVNGGPVAMRALAANRARSW